MTSSERKESEITSRYYCKYHYYCCFLYGSPFVHILVCRLAALIGFAWSHQFIQADVAVAS
jgi:hypothetical protein